jgi:hypothetical protein
VSIPPLFVCPRTQWFIVCAEQALIVQVTATFVTLLVPMVPTPEVTTQFCDGFVGFVSTVTEYVLPLEIAVGKVNAPFATSARLSPPLSCSTRLFPAAKPLSVPPTENLLAAQVFDTGLKIPLLQE